jgi:hypothetical protein
MCSFYVFILHTLDNLIPKGYKSHWNISDTSVSSSVKVRVSKQSDNTINDISDENLSISKRFTLTSPNGRESLRAGEIKSITWTNAGTVEKVKLEYTTNNGSTWNTIVENLPNTNNYAWNISDTSVNYSVKVRVSKQSDNTINDISDENFSISKRFALTSPNVREYWRAGEVRNITWIGTTDSVKLEYTTNNGSTWNTIAENLSNTNSYTWNISDTSVSSLVKVRVSKQSDNTINDISDNSFSILKRFSLTSPNGRESWRAGETKNITWTNAGTVDKVRLEYTTNNGSTWNTIAGNVSNTNSYTWNIADTSVSSLVKVRVSKQSDNTINDISDSYFIISNRFQFTSPTDSSSWKSGNRVDIRWITGGTVDTVGLEYQLQNSSEWKQIIPSLYNSGSYTWDIPDEASSSATKIRVFNKSQPSVYTISAGIAIQNRFDLTSPSRGSILKVEETKTITWTTEGDVPRVNISYSKDNGSTWESLANNILNTGTYNWDIPVEAVSQQAVIRVSNASNTQVFGQSGSFYVIGTITVQTPNGNEQWPQKSTQEITWTSKGVSNRVSLEYSTNQGRDWISITHADNNGSYSWKVPELGHTPALVRVTQAYGTKVPSDQSDTTFHVLGVPSDWKHNTKLIASNGGVTDVFGSSIAISGNMAIIGAWEDVFWGENHRSGKAYIYTQSSNGTWSETSRLLPPAENEKKRFGYSVDMEEDISVVGAPHESPNGAVYLFKKSANGTWSQFQKLTPPVGGSGDEFGTSVSIKGSTVVVGSPEDDDRGSNSGSVYLFQKEGNGTWSQKQKLTLSSASSDANFGVSLDLGDGILMVSDDKTYGRSVHVYSRSSDGNWSFVQTLSASGNGSQEFGNTLSIDGKRVLIGGTGAAYVFEEQSNGTWSQVDKLLSPYPHSGYDLSLFGRYVSLHGNVALIGSPESDEKGTNAGAAHLFVQQEDGAWSLEQTFLAYDGERSDRFGTTVAVGQGFALLGATGDSDNGSRSGSVYIFKSPTLALTSPNGGEQLEPGKTKNITWVADAEISRVELSYSTDGGTSWNAISTVSANSGEYSWTVPDLGKEEHPNVKLRIRDTDNSSRIDESDWNFTVVGKPDPVSVLTRGSNSLYLKGRTVLHFPVELDQAIVTVYNLKGETVQKLAYQGETIHWNGTGLSQQPLSEGVYFVTIRENIGSKILMKKKLWLE